MAKAKKQVSFEDALWGACDKLRGTVEPAEYKHVVLSLFFLKFASDKFEAQRKAISEKYGEYLGSIDDKKFYSFPDKTALEHISEDDYRECKTGFRAAYLKSAADRISSDENFTEEILSKMSYEDAKNELIKIKGVGEKVANCVLLFSLGFRNAFPVDVWIKRIMEFMYFQKETPNNEIMSFAKEKFGEYGGYAQQYLFYYARENGLGK